MNRPTREKRKSSHEGRVGRHKGFCYTKSKASVIVTGSVGAIGTGGDKGSCYNESEACMARTDLEGATRDRSVISFEEDATTIGGKISSGNGAMFGSPYFSQRYIQ